ncbi:MAG TPA: hypothetical protein VH835_07520, partial [Dongiaceae bacterium]
MKKSSLLRQWAILACAWLAVAISGLAACAQQRPAGHSPAVQPASFDRSPQQPRQTATFGQRTARVGDSVEQTVSL